MSQVPHLTVDDRIQYLVDKGYSKGSPVGDRVREFLPHTNFHHFLGYARNYGKLVTEGRVTADTTLETVVSVIETDRRVSALLYQAFQSYEHQLRSLLVDSHCDLFSPYQCIFSDSQYQLMNLGGRNPASDAVTQTLRMKEPYVAERLARYMRDHDLTGRPEDLMPPHRVGAVEQFPIWSIVDGLTFGTLADLILTSKPHIDEDGSRRILDAVAAGSNVHRKVFDTQLRGLIVLRNLIAHHSRLWMRPTTHSPTTPKAYAKACRNMDGNSMYVAWLTLASHLRIASEGRTLKQEIDMLIDREPAYSAGVKLPRPEKS